MSDQIPYQSLSQVVREYLLASMNDAKKYYPNYMVHAKWVWFELFLKSIFSVKNKYVKVDKTTNPYSIILPMDMVRFINLSHEDKSGNIRSYVFDDLINDVPVPTGNHCKECGDTDDYGQCVNNMSTTTKTVVIGSTSYTEKIWKKLCPNGDIKEIREIPVVDVDAAGTPTIKTVTKERMIVNLEVKPCGCVKKTAINKQRINDCCGGLLTDVYGTMNVTTLNRVGTRQGRMKISLGRIWLSGTNVPDYLILSYQTNGVCGEGEIMVPQYAVPAMIAGINYRSKALATNRDSEGAYRLYEREKQSLDEFLNPIRKEEFMNIQMVLPKWGSMVDQSDMVRSNLYDCEDVACNRGQAGMTAEDIKSLVKSLVSNITVVNNYYTDQDNHLVFEQTTPVMEAVVIHNLGFDPPFIVTDLNGVEIDVLKSYNVENVSVKVQANTPITFKVII